MQYWVIRSLLIAVFFCSGATIAAAEAVQEFQADYEIQPDGRVQVSETITYDFGDDDRHGIFRTLEKTHPQGASAWYKERYVAIVVDAVTRNGETAPYTVDDSRAQVNLRIGDADRTITGVHEYTIEYTIAGSLSVHGSSAEFYWNVTGNEWSVPMQEVTARVSGATAGLLGERQACYQGRPGDTTACDQATSTVAGRQFTASQLAPGEEMSIAVAVSDAVAPATTERWSPILLLLAVVLGWSAVLVIWIWRYRTQDDPDHPVVPQYEPYAEFLPMYTGLLFNGRLDARDISGGIVYLAEQGFIKITRTEESVWWLFSTTDYEITLERPLEDMPTRFLRDVSGLLFPDGTTVPQTERLSQLKKRQSKNQKIIKWLQRDLKQDLQDAGFMTRTITGKETAWLLVPGVVFGVLAWWWDVVIVIFLVGFVAFISTIFMYSPRRTARGYEALLHIKGFREFLRITDSERFTFHNAPEKNPQTFMEYLPYAIALGVEKEWAEVFADITIPAPEWYSDTTHSSFSAVALTNDLSSFSTAFASSSGSSASSGGGSAGGGAGGGGGGSW